MKAKLQYLLIQAEYQLFKLHSIIRHKLWFFPRLVDAISTAEQKEFDQLYKAMSAAEIDYFLNQTKGQGALWYLDRMREKYKKPHDDNNKSGQ